MKCKIKQVDAETRRGRRCDGVRVCRNSMWARVGGDLGQALPTWQPPGRTKQKLPASTRPRHVSASDVNSYIYTQLQMHA